MDRERDRFRSKSDHLCFDGWSDFDVSWSIYVCRKGSIMLNPQNYQDIRIYALQIDKPKIAQVWID